MITSSCECLQSLLLFQRQHRERAIKGWFTALTHLLGRATQDLSPSPALKLSKSQSRITTATSPVLQMKPVHELSKYLHLNIALKVLPYHLHRVQLQWRKHSTSVSPLQMNSCEQTEFPLHYVTAVNNGWRALRGPPVGLPCCLCSNRGTAWVTRRGQRSHGHSWAPGHKFFTDMSKPSGTR